MYVAFHDSKDGSYVVSMNTDIVPCVGDYISVHGSTSYEVVCRNFIIAPDRLPSDDAITGIDCTVKLL